MPEKLDGKKSGYSLFDSFSVRGRGSSVRVLKTVVFKPFSALAEKFVFTSCRSFGAMGLAYGLLSLFLYFGKSYFLELPEKSDSALIIGIVFSVIALPLIFIDKPISLFLQDFFLTDYLLFEFFSIKQLLSL